MGAGGLAILLLGGTGLVIAQRLVNTGDPGSNEGGVARLEPLELAEPGTLNGEIRGAGSTFLAGAMEAWATGYGAEQQSAVTVHYNAVGSGAGEEAFVAGEIDFGSSEDGLDRAQMEAAETARDCPVVQFPVVAGAVAVVTVNEELARGEWSASELEEYYLGEISSLEVDGVDQGEILPVRHRDEAATARVFSDFLADYGEKWSQTAGSGESTDWGERSVAADGDEGVHAQLAQFDMGIGFVNASYAQENEDLMTVPVVNGSGAAVEPTVGATQAATGQMELTEEGTAELPLVEGQAYPITRINHLFAFECGYEKDTGDVMRDFWTYALSVAGGEAARDAGYAPLGDSISQEVAGIVARVASS